MFDKEDLKLLSSRKGLKILLEDDKPDYKKTLQQLKQQRELETLQVELIRVQNWAVENDERVLILVEGREFAGKGAVIRTFVRRLNPRSMRKIALPKPSEREAGQWYFQRYIQLLPNIGEIVFFDRSWYNRAIVEPVNKFCSKDEYKRYMKQINPFESMLVEDGIRIIKFYMSISKEEQADRIKATEKNPLRKWEVTDVDKDAVKLWNVYTRFKNKMLKKTNTKKAPWTIIDANDSHQAHMTAIKHILKVLPYKKKDK